MSEKIKYLPLSVKNLSKKFGSFQAVDDVSFDIFPGEIFGLLGPNGAGKTTIISMINTLVKPTSGSVSVFGNDVNLRPMSAKRQIGPVPQEIVNHGYFTLEEILHFHSSYYGLRKNTQRIDFLLKKLELFEHKDKLVSMLSGGMKRRMTIAKALLHSPKLLLLDEPTAGVDIDLRAQLWEFVTELKKEGCSILLTTHYLEEAERLCDRIGILHHGKLKMVDQTSRLLQTLANRAITITLNEPLPTKIASPYIKCQEGCILLFVVPRSFELNNLLSPLEITLEMIRDITIREENLEDVFQKITRDQV